MFGGLGRTRRIPPRKSAEERREIRRRQAEASWYAWTFSELLRYFYGLVVLATLFFAPLQMLQAWRMPPAAMPAGLVAFLALAFDFSVLYVAWRAYLYLWAPGGRIEAMVARREGAPPEAPDREGH